MFGGGSKASAPPPPPPPPNPPTYANAARLPQASQGGAGRFGMLSNSILTSPMGALDERKTQRKSLLGQ